MPLGKDRWKRVADHFSCAVPTPRQVETIVIREALQNCSLSKCDGAVLLGMNEAALGWIDATTGNSRSRAIPSHPAIDILESVDSSVAC